jgi:hypothetical protein
MVTGRAERTYGASVARRDWTLHDMSELHGVPLQNEPDGGA